MRRVFLAFLFLIFFVPPAAAFDVEKLFEKEPGIIMELSQEQWVKAEMAKVVVSVSAASKGEDFLSVRKEVMATLKKFIDGEWRVTAYHRTEDSAGLSRINITAETRVEGKSLPDIYRRARELSRAGMQIKGVNIDYSPTLEEKEKALAEARQKIYTMAVKEAVRVSDVLSAPYKVWRIEFVALPHVRPLMKGQAVREMAVGGETPEDISREDKAVIRATVIIRQGASL